MSNPTADPPLLCRLFGHKWRICHMLKGQRQGNDRDEWIYYAHHCARCHYEKRMNLWPSL